MGIKKKMPVGIDNFKELIVENYYFVDKTGFIKELLDNHGKVTLFTRPRRFGKTITLSMLKYFFTEENADDNRLLFNDLDIERCGENYMREQGTRPVIFFTLKDAQQNVWQDESDKIKRILSQLYRQYEFLLDSPHLSPIDKNFFTSIWQGNGTQADNEESISNLCYMLNKHSGKKVVLLIDEYDAPILSAWKNDYYDYCISFIRNMLGAALKSNDSLDFAVLTGVTRVAKESIFSGLNNLDVYGVLSEQYSTVYGFTHDETAKLMQETGFRNRLPELKRWYDGYKFGQTEMYNPWSVVNFIKRDCKFQPYWINVSGNDILKELLKRIDSRRQAELWQLMNGGTVETPVKENIVYADISSGRDALYMMLLTTGYLKVYDSREDKSHKNWISLQIPNVEIRLAFEQEILQYIAPHQGEILLNDMLTAMQNGDSQKFAACLSEVLVDFVSFHDIAHSESFYHGLLLGFSVLMERDYRVESNRESGLGRFDIAFYPRDTNKAGIILEIKSAASESEMYKLVDKALEQIEKKKYITALKRCNIQNIWKYGVAIFGKKVLVKRAN